MQNGLLLYRNTHTLTFIRNIPALGVAQLFDVICFEYRWRDVTYFLYLGVVVVGSGIASVAAGNDYYII